MQPKNKSPRSIKRIILIVTIVLVLLIIAGLTSIFLKGTANKIGTTELSAADISAAYIVPNAIPGLSENLYNQQKNEAVTINYKLSNYNYSVSVAAQHSYMFSVKNKSQSDDTSVIQSQTTTFMKKENLEKTKDSVSTASNSFQISVYANDKIVCQLTDSQPIASAPANALRYHTIACVNVSDIKQEYLQIEKLLTIYRKTNKLIAFSSASRITATNGSIAYSIINLAATNYTYPRLLFAAVNDSWSYIGDLSAGDLKYSTGEYIITPEIKTKISDPKYQGFITKEIH